MPLPTLAQTALIDSLRHRLVVPLADTTRAFACYDIANAFFKQNQNDSARRYLDRMLPICQRSRFKAGLGFYELLSGHLARNRGQYEEALSRMQRAVTLFQQSTQPPAVGLVYISLGHLYKQMAENQHLTSLNRKAIDYLLLSVPIHKVSPHPHRLAQSYINLGINYEDLNELATARSYFLLAKERAEKIPNGDDYLRIALNNLGNLCLKQGQPTDAIPFLERAVTINRKLRRPSSLVHNYRNLSTAYLDTKQPQTALRYARQAMALLPESNDASLTPSVVRVLRQALAATGNYEQAYTYLLQEKLVEDSLLTLQKATAITDLQGRYEHQIATELASIQAKLALEKTREVAAVEARTAREVARIEADRKRRVAQITAESEVAKTRAVAEVQTRYETAGKTAQITELGRQNAVKSRQMAYLGGGAGLLMLLLGVSLVQYRVIRRTNGQLQNQNRLIAASSQQLTQQSGQLQTLMRELHHRVKNNLAIVSSLLNLQTYRLADQNRTGGDADGHSEAIEAVQESQRRVEAMSLIHQRLYRTDAIASINMTEYITELAENLMAAYGYYADTFALSVTVDQPAVDVDIAIPMGLILNELLTNSFKYAFGQRRADDQLPALTIALCRQPCGLMLRVQDNGPGLDLEPWQNPDTESDSFGRQLIGSLTEQLGGQLTVDNRGGACFQLCVPQTT